MKGWINRWSNILVVIAAISFLVSLVVRVSMTRLPFGIVGSSLNQFTTTCLLFAITLMFLAKR